MRYLEGGADPDAGIAGADAFLSRYPLYAEAHRFKAGMLLAKGRGRGALRCLKAARKIDDRKIYGFDEAEASYMIGRIDEAVRGLTAQIESLLDEIQFGTHVFLMTTMISRADQAEIEREIRKEVLRVITGKSKRLARHRIAASLKRARRREEGPSRRRPLSRPRSRRRPSGGGAGAAAAAAGASP
jgi:hypothetical protein